MRRLLVVLALLIPFAAAVRAQDCSADVAALGALYDLRNMTFRGYSSSYDLDRRLDHYLEEFRDPLPGGGYRWVRFVRPSGDGPVLKREHLVAAGYDSGDRDSFEASGDHPYAVRVVVPRKRTMVRANKEVWVGDVTIRYTENGREKTLTKSVGQWMQPDTSKTFDLGVIADSADVTLESAAREANRKEALVEIHFRQAVAQDDPENPKYDAIQSLKRLSTNSFDPVSMDYEIARFERRLFGTPTSAPLSSIHRKLQEAEKLLKSEKTEEQEKGRKLLSEASKELGTVSESKE